MILRWTAGALADLESIHTYQKLHWPAMLASFEAPSAIAFTHLKARRLPFPSLLGKVARSAGWGMARCLNRSRIARPPPRTCIDTFLHATPHPAFGHVPASRRRGNLPTARNSMKSIANSNFCKFGGRQREGRWPSRRPRRSGDLAQSCYVILCLEASAMNIASAKVDELAQRLARLTGEDVETALERAIGERLARVAVAAHGDRRAAIQRFFDRVSQMPVADPRSADEIMGFGPR